MLLRLAVKNSANDNTATIQNLGWKMLSTDRPTTAATPVAFDPRKNGQRHAHSAISTADKPLRMPLT